MAPTNRTPLQVIRDVDRAWFPDDERYARAIEDALADEGWIRTPAERFAAHMTPSAPSASRDDVR